jgi:hypothetical protein
MEKNMSKDEVSPYQIFLGYNPLDCVVKDKNHFYFVAKEDYTEWPGRDELDLPPASEDLTTRVISIQLEGEAEVTVKHIKLYGFLYPIYCELSYEETVKPVVMDVASNAWVNNPPSNGKEKPIAAFRDGGPLRGGITRLRSYSGAVIASSNNRDLLIRKGVEDWGVFEPPLPIDLNNKQEDRGFKDFDAFSMQDIYAAGGKGDVWRFDGKEWLCVDIPLKRKPSAICCAGDGYVYIGLEGGTVLRGRENSWEKIHEDRMVLPYKDMVWYENKVWCTSDYGVWVIEDGILRPADIPSDIKICAGNLSTRDGVLLIAGHGGAAYKRDGAWNVLFHAYKLKEQARDHS